MSDAKPPDPDADAREAARLAWEKGELQPGDSTASSKPIPEDDADDVPFRRRSRPAYPASFKLLLAGALGFLALEPTADLSYEAFGPSEVLDLGHPTDFHLDQAVDGARAKIEGFASNRRGTYTHFGSEYEVVALVGTPVLVRRSPEPPAPPSSVELYNGEGRLVRLDDAPQPFFERLLRPAARYGTVKATFVTYGEIAPGRTAWLLLDGDLPRSSASAIVIPMVLWILSIFLVFSAVRGWLRR